MAHYLNDLTLYKVKVSTCSLVHPTPTSVANFYPSWKRDGIGPHSFGYVVFCSPPPVDFIHCKAQNQKKIVHVDHKAYEGEGP